MVSPGAAAATAAPMVENVAGTCNTACAGSCAARRAMKSIVDLAITPSCRSHRADEANGRIGPRGTKLSRATRSRSAQEERDRVFDCVQKALRGGWRVVAEVKVCLGEVLFSEAVPGHPSSHERVLLGDL